MRARSRARQLGMTRGSSMGVSSSSVVVVLGRATKPALMVWAPLSRTSVRDGGGGGAGLDFRGAMAFFLVVVPCFGWVEKKVRELFSCSHIWHVGGR